MDNISSELSENGIQTSFKRAYKKASQLWPNFGARHKMPSDQWWINVVLNTFYRSQMIANASNISKIGDNRNEEFLVAMDLKQLNDVEIFAPVNVSMTSGQNGVLKAPFLETCRDIVNEFQTKAGYKLYSDVIPFLSSIKTMNKNVPNESIIVGCISNSISEYRDKIVPDLGLKEYIDFVLVSQDIDVAKPDPIIFEKALQIANGVPILKNSQHELQTNTNTKKKWHVVHVGNDLEKDIFGAVQMGWIACWMIRNKDITNHSFYKQQILEKGKLFWNKHFGNGYLIEQQQWNQALQQNVHIVHDLKMIQDLGLL
ncbi:hypothetical protein RFI_39893 [Reticulomyxa filosa]|uniref:Uncharacterized protein n=1 Tax=Reticulomyxa filosa TaxID=46433 RepID=X6LA71_RETFI|nr:hypothetical protein RFI_39893 [Reticulomyxa filosa]|eukprot:ETN97639.1 hypothetical protein RFI_39893 [Reticulomyxa filosa]